MARSQPVSTTDTQARCTHFKALGFMARPQSLETRRGQTWPLPLGCQQDHALISARPLCLLPHPPSYVIPAWPRGAEQSACSPKQESFGGRQEICGLHPLPAQAGPSRNREIKGPTRTPGDTVQRPLPPTSSDARAAGGEGRGPEGITERNPPLPGPCCQASHPWKQAGCSRGRFSDLWSRNWGARFPQGPEVPQQMSGASDARHWSS